MRFKNLRSVSLIPDSRRPAFTAGFISVPNVGGAWYWHPPWWCGLEQPRSHVTGPIAKLEPTANVYKYVKGFDQISYPHLGWSNRENSKAFQISNPTFYRLHESGIIWPILVQTDFFELVSHFHPVTQWALPAIPVSFEMWMAGVQEMHEGRETKLMPILLERRHASSKQAMGLIWCCFQTSYSQQIL